MSYQPKREPLSVEEVDRFVNAAQGFTEKLVCWVLLDTGLRVSELAGLTKDNCLWQERRLVIYGKGGQHGKQSKRRVVPMTERVRLLLERHFTFDDDFGLSPRGIQKIVKRVANRAGISKPVSPHVLRITFSVICARKGMSVVTIKELLGHDRIETTMIYLNMLPEDVMRDFESKW